MKKQDLLKAPPAGKAVNTMNGQPSAMLMAPPPKGKLVVFVNENSIPMDWYEKIYKPVHAKRFKEILLIPIRIPQGKSFGDAVRAYILSK